MNKLAELLGALTNEQSQRLFELGVEETVPEGRVLVEEGTPIETLYFILEGLFHIQTRSVPGPLAILGHGEIVGEMSFIDPHEASASVVAAEDSRVLALRHATLRAFLEADPVAAASMYRSLAAIVSRRLRRTMGYLSRQSQERAASQGEHFSQIREFLDVFKEAMLQFDKATIKKDVARVAELEREIRKQFQAFTRKLNETVGGGSDLSEVARTLIGQMVQRELMPYLQMTECARRFYAKPRGYAGDFFSIELIYRNSGDGTGHVGPLLDDCFLAEPAAQAVRNRRGLLAREIVRTLEQVDGRPARVTSLACGPAREVFDVYERLTEPSRLEVTLVDMDTKALSFVSNTATERHISRHIRLVPENLIYLAVGRRTLDIDPQHLIYSIGLIDYFGDQLVIKLLDYIYTVLAPGGRVILGNFHPSNPTKALMEHVLEWNLVHRSEQDMDRLFEASRFGRGATNITYEEQGINLFAECIRES